MKFLSPSLKLAALLGVLAFGSQSVQAQATGNAGAQNSTAGGEEGNQSDAQPSSLTTEIDTSAFGAIERGDTIGTATESGFGLAAESNAGGGVGGIGGGGLGAFGGGLGGFGGLNNLFGGLGQQGGQSSKPVLRTRIRSAVKIAPAAPAMVQREASIRLRQASSDRQLRGVNVQMIGRTAVLTGTVANESDRRMSELMLRLEPGVSSVENRVVVLPQ